LNLLLDVSIFLIHAKQNHHENVYNPIQQHNGAVTIKLFANIKQNHLDEILKNV